MKAEVFEELPAAVPVLSEVDVRVLRSAKSKVLVFLTLVYSGRPSIVKAASVLRFSECHFTP